MPIGAVLHDVLSGPTSFLFGFGGGSKAPTGLEFREYYGAACPHCVHLAPAWKEAAAAYDGPVKFRQIECLDDNWQPVAANQELCKNIGGFPTIKLYNGDTELAEYNGPRTADSLVKFVKNQERLVTQAVSPLLAVGVTSLKETLSCKAASSSAGKKDLANFL
eukprot:TRINITY_DN12434_c0_g1_i1.p1 TRINITY_DN12434_c0_g1~~TRINITY_DN12434_c0_g1_i1.p1  ORF type:complete len:163 (+),score=31.63 TRINITY_DN12434_c0_g1_i1:236-724(+)